MSSSTRFLAIGNRILAAQSTLLSLTALCLFDAVAAQSQEFPPELTRFKPYQHNPVFVAAGPGHWDVKIRERGWILHEPDGFHMWFTGYDGTRSGLKKLGYAFSQDGVSWKRFDSNPIYDQHWVEDMIVVKNDGTYYMFAEGRGDQPHLFTSTDRIRWNRQGKLDVRYRNGEPLTAGPYGTPTVWLENGVWHLFYERRDEGVWLAKSRDLKVWHNVQDEPVLKPGPSRHDRDLIAMNQVVKHKGRYYAYYHGANKVDKPTQWCTCIAVSDNLLKWKKDPSNPVLKENKSSGILVSDGKRLLLYSMHNEVHLHLPVK